MSNDNARNHSEKDSTESRPCLESGVYKTFPKEDGAPNPLIGKVLNFIRVFLIVIVCIAFFSIPINGFFGDLTERIFSLIFSITSLLLLNAVSILYDKYK